MPIAKTLFHLLFFLCLLISAAGSKAQTDIYENTRFRRYDVEHGLPSGACSNICKDSYGYLWISNYYGISIFNGTRFFNLPIYASDDKFNLSQKPHNFLQLDSFVMLIGSPGGLYKYNYATNIVQRLQNQPLPLSSRQSIQLLALSPSGKEIYAQAGGKLYILDTSITIKKVIPLSGVNPVVRVNNISMGSDYVYVSTSGYLIKVGIAENRTDTLLGLPRQTETVVINGSSKHEYFLCADQHLYRIHKKTGKIIASINIPATPGKNITVRPAVTALDDQGNYWIGGHEQLLVYHPDNNAITDISPSLVSSCRKGEAHVVDLKINGDEICLSTEAASGILISERTSAFIKNYDHFDNNRNAIFSIAIHNNQLWCAGLDGGINIIEPQKPANSAHYYPVKGLDSRLIQLEELDAHHLWGIAWKNFKLTVINTDRLTAHTPQFPVDSLALIHKESFDSVMPMRDAAPIIKKAGEQLFYYSVNHSLFKVEGNIRDGFSFTFLDSIAAPYYITCLDILSSGELVAGTSSLQVYRLDNKKLVKVIDSFHPNIPVRYVLEDSRGNKYLLTTNGIYMYDAALKLRKTLSAEKGEVPGNIIYSGFIDTKDLLWATTNGGAFVFDCRQNNLFNLSSLKAISNFEFNNKSFATDKCQYAYFGGSEGVTAVNTDLFSNTRRDFQLVLLWIKNQDSILYNRLLPGSVVEKKLFPYNRNNFSFSVHAISTLQPELFEIRYMMEGIDSVWRVPVAGSIEFVNLSPGTYRFRVRGKYSNSDIVREVSYSFQVNEPFWRQAWFTLSISIAATILIYFLLNYQYQKKIGKQRVESTKQMALKAERERISQELHDDLGSGLTAIRLLSKSAAAHSGSARVPSMLGNIDKISGELIDQMSEIIWVLNHSDDTFNGLMAHLRVYMAGYLHRIELAMRLELNSAVQEDFGITHTQRRNILLVAKEAFHNAVKHSQADLFSIHCSIVSSSILLIVISDNGVGMPAQSVPAGNGVNNIQKRMASINGVVRFENNNGTNIIINIFLHKDSIL